MCADKLVKSCIVSSALYALTYLFFIFFIRVPCFYSLLTPQRGSTCIARLAFKCPICGSTYIEHPAASLYYYITAGHNCGI
jgi:hypothetical protein